jgi:hypothetical protein
MTSVFDELLNVAERLSLVVRHAHLGGDGGGVAVFKSQRQLFIDLDADAADQLEQTVKTLAAQPGQDQLFIRPDVRELLERHRSDAYGCTHLRLTIFPNAPAPA